MEYEGELNEKISTLFAIVQEKDATIISMQNKISSLTTIVNILIEGEPNNKKYKISDQTLAKREFYKNHKNDPEVIKEMELFKQTFPYVKTPPCNLKRSITNRLYNQGIR